MEEKIRCNDCGEEITGEVYYNSNGDAICEMCRINNYGICEDCGELIENEYLTYIEDADCYVCEDCLDNYTRCEDCGDWYKYNTYYVEGRGNVCEDCLNNGNYGTCEDCGNTYHLDDLEYHEGDDCYYCGDCYGDHVENHDTVYGYHEFNSWKLFKGNNEKTPPYYIGKEIELEAKNDANLKAVLGTMDKYINAVAMRDGSLSYGGVEIVTHPESWKYLQENKEKYKQFFKHIEELEYGDNGGTGLHFHVTRPNEDVISRIIVILESFKDEIKKLSRRGGDFHWSRFITDNGRDEMDNLKFKSTKYIKDEYINKRDGDRYVALNLTNKKTIEFRFFNGANNFEEFWGALQFIHNLMDVALNETRGINTISWGELIKGKELEAQAIKQGVSNVDKHVKDTTEILERIEEAQKKTREEIKKTLKNFIKYLSKEMQDKKLEIVNKDDVNTIELNINNFMETFSNDLRYLQRLTSVYRNVDNDTINGTKYNINYIKDHYTRNKNGYARYFKQIEKSINDFESEVLN